MRSLTMSLFIVVLSGCASSEKLPVLLHEVLKPGDQLVVAKPVKLEPVNQAIYFENGELHKWWGANVWRPLCRLRVAHGVRSELLAGSVFEVVAVRRALLTKGDMGEVTSIDYKLRTVSGARVEELHCECWRDYLQYTHMPSDVTLEDFQHAVNGYLQIVGHATISTHKEKLQKD